MSSRNVTAFEVAYHCRCRIRDQLREQNALSEEIVQAITSSHIGEPLDEDELDDELEALQQEALDSKMLDSGTVPVTVHKLPSVANSDSTAFPASSLPYCFSIS